MTPDELVVALDCVQDPGNLGTIVRAADWMGVTTILASADTADIFGAKAIQATMGAVSRVRVHYCDLPSALSALLLSRWPNSAVANSNKYNYGQKNCENRLVLH